MVLCLHYMCVYLLLIYFKTVHSFIVWLFYCTYKIHIWSRFMQIWYYSLCLRMLVCTDAWRLLLYFVDDLVAVGRGEAIDTMPYSADNGCRAVTAFPFQCTNTWWSFYMYLSYFIPFELLYCFYYCLFLSEVTNQVVQSCWIICNKYRKTLSRTEDMFFKVKAEN